MSSKKILHNSSFFSQIIPSHLSSNEVVKKLSTIATEERWLKIQKVVASRSFDVGVLMEDIYDQGNINAVMRSAEAFGFMPFYILDYNKKNKKTANRVSQGADKWLDITKFNSLQTSIDTIKNASYKIYGTSLKAAKPIEEVDFSVPHIIVMGNEHKGLSAEMEEAVDLNFKIPMQGFSQSFNISVAAAISLSYIFQYRKSHKVKECLFTKNNFVDLQAQYLWKSVQSAEKYFL
ncbi:MAG: RNA methyltransferase [Bdellovibrionaceae bacterium]|nr:RNA methyltransferase [Pseudobdellovibrionaceae bacterium]